jgi:hypothetical protein
MELAVPTQSIIRIMFISNVDDIEISARLFDKHPSEDAEPIAYSKPGNSVGSFITNLVPETESEGQTKNYLVLDFTAIDNPPDCPSF